MKKLMCVSTLLAFAMSLFAQAPEMGPAPELKKLDWFVGKWTGTMKMTIQGSASEGEMTFVNAFDGNFIKTTSNSDMGGMTMTETSYLAWNAKTSKYVSYTFTNFAPMPRIEHGTLEGDKFVFLSEPWDVMGTTYESRATLTRKGTDQIVLLLEFKQDGKWEKAGEGTFKKTATNAITR